MKLTAALTVCPFPLFCSMDLLSVIKYVELADPLIPEKEM